MGHLYEVTTSDGGRHNVETPHHHADHDEPTFQRHLLDVIKQAGAQILSGVVVHRIIYRGRR